MFDLVDRPLVWVPFIWPGLKPAGDDKVAVIGENLVELRIELVDRDEAQALFPGAFGLDQEPKLNELDTFKRVVHDWRKVAANKVPLAFTDENIGALLKYPGFAYHFAGTYITALAGRIETREGNSNDLPSGGQVESSEAATTTKSPETAPGSA